MQQMLYTEHGKCYVIENQFNIYSIMPKHTKKPIHTDGFLMRNIKGAYRGGKSTVVKHGVTGVVALIMGSVVPMLNTWHADKQHDDEVKSIRQDASDDTKDAEQRVNQEIRDLEARLNKRIDDVQSNGEERTKAIWDYIGKQKNTIKK